MMEGIGDERIVGGRNIDETHASIVVLRVCHCRFAVKRKKKEKRRKKKCGFAIA